MRWFVEISSLGQSQISPTVLCVEAPQWQPALQKARELRGDEGALTNFSIELLDDGYRAIDPTTRLKYVVRKAPDDAALTNGSTPAREAKPSRPVQIPTDPVPKASLPGFVVVSQREAKPSEKSPLTYREVVYAVAEGTSESQASALIHDRFAEVRASLEGAPAGKLVNLAVFDHVYDGKPRRAPLVTLSWKDWKGSTPEVRFPRRDGPGDTPTQPMVVPSSPPSAPSAPATKADAPRSEAATKSAPPASTSDPPTPVVTTPAVTTPAVTTPAVTTPVVSTPAVTTPAVTTPASTAPAKTDPVTGPVPASISAAPETAPSITEAKPRSSSAATERTSAPSPAAPEKERSAQAPASTSEPPARSTMPTAPTPAKAKKQAPSIEVVSAPPPSKRLAGDELIAELFEAFSDLHFHEDSLAGADFVLALTMEKLPSEVGLVSFFDINKREFVVVRQVGGESGLLARIPEKSPLAQAAMRSHRAIVVADASADERILGDARWKQIGVEVKSLVCAPVEVGGRYLGLLELANPLDGRAFSDDDGHALTYIGEQLAEFVAARGVIVDAEHVLRPKGAGR